MADEKLSALVVLDHTGISSTDPLYIVDSSATASKQITIGELATSVANLLGLQAPATAAFGTTSATVATGDAPANAVSAFGATLGGAALLEVGTTSDTVAAGDAPFNAVNAMPTVDTSDHAKCSFSTSGNVTTLDVTNLVTAAGSGLLVAASNLSDVTNAATARTNLSVPSLSQIAGLLGNHGGWALGTDTNQWWPSGSWSAATMDGGIIKQGTSIQLSQSYTSSGTVNAAGDNFVNSAVRYTMAITANETTSLVGPALNPKGSTGPGGIFNIQGTVTIGANQSRLGWGPIGYQSQYTTANAVGSNRTMAQGWDFLSARTYWADTNTVTWSGPDSANGGASFTDNQLWFTQNAGVSAAAASGSEIISFLSIPFMLGNTTKTARVGLDVQDINNQTNSVYHLSDADQTTFLAGSYPNIDAPNMSLPLNIGLRVGHMTHGDHQLGVLNASGYAATPYAVSLTAAGNSLPNGAELLALTATSALTLTSTPTLADGYNGELVTVMNVGANAVTLQDEAALAGSNLSISATNGAVTLNQWESITLRFSSSSSKWEKHSRSDPLRGQPTVYFPSGGEGRFRDAFGVCSVGVLTASDTASTVSLVAAAAGTGQLQFSDGTGANPDAFWARSAAGTIDFTDGTSGHGVVRTSVSALGQGVNLFGAVGDTAAKAQYLNNGVKLGPGGSTATDFTLLRTGTAAGTLTGQTTIATGLTFGSGINIATNTGTGTIIAATTSQKLGFWGAAAVAQYATTGTTTGFTASTGTTVVSGSTFTGNTGSTAYTIGDIVRALKLAGVVAA